MDLMDTSVEVDNNPILHFLENNLKRVISETDKIQKTNDHLIAESDEVLKEVADEQNGIEIRFLCKKLFWDKYALWFHVKNKTEGCLRNFNFALNWTSTEVLSYVSSMHPAVKQETQLNSPLEYLDELDDEALLLVTLDRPICGTELSVEMTGFLTYCSEDGDNYADDIPDMVLKAEDTDDTSISISPINQDGDLIVFYTRLLCSWKVDLVIELSESQRIVDVLQIGGLTPLSPRENVNQRFFTVSEKSPLFDGTILEITDMKDSLYDISVYTKDESSLLAFVHYLHQKLRPVILLPAELKSRIPQSTNSGSSSEIEKCISKEIEFLKSYMNEQSFDMNEHGNMRMKLSCLEYDTDLEYLKLLVADDRDQIVDFSKKEGKDEAQVPQM